MKSNVNMKSKNDQNQINIISHTLTIYSYYNMIL